MNLFVRMTKYVGFMLCCYTHAHTQLIPVTYSQDTYMCVCFKSRDCSSIFYEPAVMIGHNYYKRWTANLANYKVLSSPLTHKYKVTFYFSTCANSPLYCCCIVSTRKNIIWMKKKKSENNLITKFLMRNLNVFFLLPKLSTWVCIDFMT